MPVVFIYFSFKFQSSQFCVTVQCEGNMALRFDSSGTCLIVRQYLERSRNLLRGDLLEKIQLLFSQEIDPPKRNHVKESQTLAKDDINNAGKANGTSDKTVITV
jgi:hypothetical protein